MLPLRALLPIAFAAASLLPASGAGAQVSQAAPVLTEVSPPNWWANMPAAQLLIRGLHLSGARFTLSDPSLAVTSIRISQNGDWAVLHLSQSPAEPEQVRLQASTPQGITSLTYNFQKRRTASNQLEGSDGFAGFSSRDVMYLIMTDRFADGDPQNDGPDHRAELAKPRGWHGGDLRGVMNHLDYLQALGITTVWITPVYQNHEPESYHGYGATDMYKVDEHYGTLADLQHLGDALHARHMKLVLDMVPNHVGPGNPWVNDEPEPDWFHGTQQHHFKAQTEFPPLVDPHAAWRDQRDILQGWFADTLPDMNQENPDVSQYLIQNTIWWVEQSHADGIRIDTFPYVGRPFWHNYHAALRALYPNLTSVGEIFNADPVITSAFAGGVLRDDLNGQVDTGLTTPLDYPTYFALRNVLLRGHPMTELASILRQDSLYPHPERLVPFLGNHDTKRFLSEENATPDKLRLAFAILLTMRGMPQLYSGDEIAMSGGDDPDNRHDFPGGFPADTQNAFLAAGRTPQQQSMFIWVQQLLHLRAATPALNSGDEQLLHADDDTLIYTRGFHLNADCATQNGARVLIAINKSEAAKPLTLDTRNTALEGCTTVQSTLGTLHASAPASDGALALTLPPGISILAFN